MWKNARGRLTTKRQAKSAEKNSNPSSTTSCPFAQTIHRIWKNGLKIGNIQISKSENT